ncbi:carboxymuconolactone decarboxylase family protein [Streptomyces laculatispora]|uniref:Carboxymuconolactone decarboxylase family protein n=1 Tax=Streptomyces laculatispora TaxID=887464 RepID=A0ABY9IEJ0_9ACTN|nr:carboxymuconolactone decarboxylase family protein [Streptomyces laculatispora]WLQ45084.1 carboxymuconolactone decarboxylase family protein [Streptomyces laculatispora]
MKDRRLLVQAPLRGLSLLQVRHISTVPFGEATGDTARVYREMEQDFGVLAPPIALHAPAPELLAASWMALRETMLVDGLVPRAAKEAVAAAVSRGNQCPFCTTMHSTMHNSLTSRPTSSWRDMKAWPEGGAGTPDQLTAWIGSAGKPPFEPELLPELAGTAFCLQYLNRMVNVFLGPQPLPPHAPVRAVGPVLRVLTGLMRSSVRARTRPGTSLSLLPDAPLPEDLGWAAADPRIAGALARSTAAVELTAVRLVPEPVRALVAAELARWDGSDPGLDRAWLDAPLRELSPADRPAGELALLTALASYRVDDKVIAAFRQDGSGDREILAVTSWAGLRAARRRSGQLLTDN